jgi:hypothetical protein
MAALTTNRSTLRQGFEALVPSYNYGIAAATRLFSGGMVALNAAGFLVAVTGAAAQNIVGVTDVATPAGLDNTGGANGALNAGVRRGIFLMNMGTAGDAVTQATIGLPVYALDDNTVTPVATAHTKVGIAMSLEAGQVWVQIIGPT